MPETLIAQDHVNQTTESTAEARAIAEEAYVFGFAIVENNKAVWAYGVEPKSPVYGGFNAVHNETQLKGPDDTAVVSANNDTFYTSALMDLRAEPVVLEVPQVTDRYYSFMLVDMVTDNFDYVGTRATGTKAGTYAVTGPGWKGHLPKGVSCAIPGAPKESMMRRHIATRRKDPMASSFVQKSRSLQSQRPANRIKSHSSRIPMSPPNYISSERQVAGCERRSSGRMVGKPYLTRLGKSCSSLANWEILTGKPQLLFDTCASKWTKDIYRKEPRSVEYGSWWRNCACTWRGAGSPVWVSIRRSRITPRSPPLCS